MVNTNKKITGDSSSVIPVITRLGEKHLKNKIKTGVE